MNGTGASLAGRSILVVEGEPLIALDIVNAFELVGAQVAATSTLSDAARLVEANGLSAAILDHGIGRDNSSALRIRLRERGIPYVIYTGYDKVRKMAPEGEPRVSKPANPDVLVAMVAGFLQERLAAEYHGA